MGAVGCYKEGKRGEDEGLTLRKQRKRSGSCVVTLGGSEVIHDAPRAVDGWADMA